MAQKLANRRSFTVILTLAVAMVAAVGTAVWWTLPAEERHLSAQAEVEDICATSTSTEPDHYDYVTVLTDTSNRGVFVERTEFRKSSDRQHMIVTDGDGNMLGEAIIVDRQTSGGDDTTRTTESQDVRDVYLRRLDKSGQLGEWETHTGPNPFSDSTASRSTKSDSSGSGEDPPTFCGLPLEIEGHDVEFRFVGNETIDGVETRHYFHSYSQTGDSGYNSTEYWLDSDELLRKVRRESYNPYYEGDVVHTVVSVTTFSGIGETNVITPPSIATATPAPSEPGATSTPTGGDSSATPAATSTPAPTATPAPTVAPTSTPDPGNTFTASFQEVPDSHDGQPFTIELHFNHDITPNRMAMGRAIQVDGGSMRLTQAESGNSSVWNIRITPSTSTVTVTIREQPNCRTPLNLCHNGIPLSPGASAGDIPYRP